MNAALVAKRYAKALMALAGQNGTVETVRTDMLSLQQALKEELAHTGNDGILDSCLTHLCPEVQRFVSVVAENGRACMLTAMIQAFLRQYNQERGITTAQLVTASPSPGLEQKLLALLHEKGYSQVDFSTKVDPSLTGGFILQIEDKRLDASLATQLKTLRRKFEEKNRALV